MASVKLVYAGFSSPNCECAIMASKKKIRQKESKKCMMSENDWAIVANRKLMRGCSVMYPMMRKRVPRKRMNALYLYSISVWNKRSMELVAAK